MNRDSTFLSQDPPPATRRRGRPRLQADAGAVQVADLLLHAATVQFAAYGFEAVGVRQIAMQAGVDAAMIMHHFGSKLRLWQAAVDRLSEEMLAAFDGLPAELPVTHDAAMRLNQALGHIIDLLCDRPELAAFILREVVLDTERSDYSYDRLVRPIRDVLNPIIADYVGSCGAGGDVDMLFVALNGAIVTSIAARPLIRRMSATMLDEAEFRASLKATLSAQMALRAGQAKSPM